uniref:Putative ovule protein n=1 Tax=Solanum chacoense TaxID=4108 RepID=A0A0V0H8R1_SOLCH
MVFLSNFAVWLSSYFDISFNQLPWLFSAIFVKAVFESNENFSSCNTSSVPTSTVFASISLLSLTPSFPNKAVKLAVEAGITCKSSVIIKLAAPPFRKTSTTLSPPRLLFSSFSLIFLSNCVNLLQWKHCVFCEILNMFLHLGL